MFTRAEFSKQEHNFPQIYCAQIHNNDIGKFFLKLYTRVFLKNCAGRVRSFKQAVAFVMFHVGLKATWCLS